MKVLKYYNINETGTNTFPEMEHADYFYVNSAEDVIIILTNSGYSIYQLLNGEFTFIDEYDYFYESYELAKEL